MKKNLITIVSVLLFIITTACDLSFQGNSASAISSSNSSSSSSVPVNEQTHLHIYNSLYSTDFCFVKGDGLVVCSNGSDSFNSDTQLLWGGIHIPGVFNSLVNFGDTVAMGIGGGQLCALEANHTVQCWGWNNYGQLGNNTSTSNYQTPNSVTLASNAYSIAANRYSTCASLDNGQVQCWGSNNDGQLGNGDISGASQSSPVTVLELVGSSSSATLTGVNTVYAGNDLNGNSFNCAVTSDGHAKCWGSDNVGQLGNGYTPQNSISFVALSVVDANSSAISSVSALCTGGEFACALHTGGTVDCWGDDTYGQLGNGSSATSALYAVAVKEASSSLSSVTQITCGDFHACALISDGSIKCWGSDQSYELGDQQSSSNQDTAVAVSGLSSSAIEVSAGFYRTCALLADTNTVQCWGNQVNTDGTAASAPTTLESINPSSTPTALTFAPLGPSFTNNCFPVGIFAVNSSGSLASQSTVPQTNVDLTVSSGHGTFYSDSGCTSSTSSASISAGNNSTVVYFGDSYSVNVNQITVSDQNTSTGLSSSPSLELDVLYSGC